MATIWSIRFVLSFLTFAHILFFGTILGVSASTNVGKEKCVGKYPLLEKSNLLTATMKMGIKYNNFDKIPTKSIMENNGHTLKVELDYNDTVPTIEVDFGTNLGIDGVFRFKYLYFQWRKAMSDYYNYENVSFAAELHVIFYNVEAKSYKYATLLNRRIVVLAFRAMVRPVEDDFNFFRDNLRHVREANSKTSIDNIDLNNWARPISQRFMVHEGSLLEFDCRGVVLWIDYLTYFKITPKTIEEFQKLKAHDGNPLMDKIIDIIEPKGVVYINKNRTSRAKKNNIEMPKLTACTFCDFE